MIVLDTERPSGKAIIDKEIRTIEMIEQIVSEPSGICKGKGQVVPVENITCHYEYLTEVEFEVRLPPPPKPVRKRKSLVNLAFLCFRLDFHHHHGQLGSVRVIKNLELLLF